MSNKLILGIESTCDETAAAVVVGGQRVLSNVVATQYELHRKFGGVVPEIASRAHIERIVPVVDEAVRAAGVTLAEIDAVAVAHRPGLVGSLLIGVTAAKTLAWTLGKPLVGVDHVLAHLYAVCLQKASAEVAVNEAMADVRYAAEVQFPAVGLVVSGGHTALYLMQSWLDVTLVGKTLDDAAGEAYDKVAAILGMEYPGGPEIDRVAREYGGQGGERGGGVRFPRSMMGRESLDFSFSGLKTSVLYHVRPMGQAARMLSEQERAAVCVAFQEAVVDVLMEKVRRAIERYGAKTVVVGGGVSCNSGVRGGVTELGRTMGVGVKLAAAAYCTDNAAMSAGLGHVMLEAGRVSGLDMDAITHSGIPME